MVENEPDIFFIIPHLALTNLFFSSGEVDVTGRATFFSTFSKASFPSANLGKNDSFWLVCRHLFCFLKIGPYFHLSKRSPRSAVSISPSSWPQGPAFAKTASSSLVPGPLGGEFTFTSRSAQRSYRLPVVRSGCSLVSLQMTLRVCGRGRGYVSVSEALACVLHFSHFPAVVLIIGQCDLQTEETQSQKQNSRPESGF